TPAVPPDPGQRPALTASQQSMGGVAAWGRWLRRGRQQRPHLLPHEELLDLAGHRHGKCRHEPHISRDLMMCDLLAAKFPDFVARGVHTRPQHHPRTDFLPVFRVRYTEYLDGLNLGMPIEKFLDL